MKKILLIIFLFNVLFVKAQFPNNTPQGNPNAMTVFAGGVKSIYGIQNAIYTDTTAANAQTPQLIKNIPAFQIYTSNDNNFWMRNFTTTEWIKITNSSSTLQGLQSVLNTDNRITQDDSIRLLNNSLYFTDNTLGTIGVFKHDIFNAPSIQFGDVNVTQTGTRLNIFPSQQEIEMQLVNPPNGQLANMGLLGQATKNVALIIADSIKLNAAKTTVTSLSNSLVKTNASGVLLNADSTTDYVTHAALIDSIGNIAGLTPTLQDVINNGNELTKPDTIKLQGHSLYFNNPEEIIVNNDTAELFVVRQDGDLVSNTSAGQLKFQSDATGNFNIQSKTSTDNYFRRLYVNSGFDIGNVLIDSANLILAHKPDILANNYAILGRDSTTGVIGLVYPSFPTGTVTSVATNNGTGITGGTITTTGTLAIDTINIIATKDKVRKDSALFYPKSGGNLNAGAFVGFPTLSAQPATPSSGWVNMYFDSSNRLSYVNSSGYRRTYSMRYQGDQLWYFPYKATGGTLVDSTDNASSLATKWSNTGNSGTNSSTNYIGTSNSASLSIRTNGNEKIFIDSSNSGSTGLGINFSPSGAGKTTRSIAIRDNQGIGAAIYSGTNCTATASNSNYSIFFGSTSTTINAPVGGGDLQLQFAGNSKMQITNTMSRLIGNRVGVSASAGQSIPASAILALESTTQGFVPPVMSSSNVSSISSPVKGLTVYDTTISRMRFYNGTAWTVMPTSNSVITTGTTTTVLSNAVTAYTHNGGIITYTMYPLAGNAELQLTITNIGIGTITLNSSAGANDFNYGGVAMNSISVLTGETYYIRNDGVQFIVND